MKIGIPKEIKDREYRVALTGKGVRELLRHGHQVYVENNAGIHIGINNQDYLALGAEIKETKKALYEVSDLIVKVKEPQWEETAWMQEEQVIFSYLHLAAAEAMTECLLEKRITGIAFETITGDHHPLPLLFPMSDLAGKLAIQVGAYYLEKSKGGRGVLLGGAVGTKPARVVILGAGTSGTAAAKMALGMGAQVVVFSKSLDKIHELTTSLRGSYQVLYRTREAVAAEVCEADLVVGSVMLPGGMAPKVVSRKMVQSMRAGAVIVDISIDQGGCIETSRATRHSDPSYVEEGVIHYCVPNMPASVPLTASHALENSILTYLLQLVNSDSHSKKSGKRNSPGIHSSVRKALKADPHLLNGLNVYQGEVTNQAVATALGKKWVDPLILL